MTTNMRNQPISSIAQAAVIELRAAWTNSFPSNPLVKHGRTIIRYHARDIELFARDASRTAWTRDGKGSYLQPTGGALLRVIAPSPAWTTAFDRYTRSERLKKGWSQQVFEHAIDRLMRYATGEIDRFEHVERVWRAEQLIEHTPAFIEAVQAEETRLGRTSSYDSMAIEDANLWNGWLAQWRWDHPEAVLSAPKEHWVPA